MSARPASAQFVQYSFAGAAGDEASSAPDAPPATGTASAVRRGSGLTPSLGAGTFSGSGFAVAPAPICCWF